MKQTNLFSILITSFLMCIFTGCDNTDPISLGGVTEVTIHWDLHSKEIEISGGDGSYTATSNDTEIVRAEIVLPATLKLSAVAIGNTTVIINDQSGNNFRVDVTVSYRTMEMLIGAFGVVIEGVEQAQKSEIEEEAIERMPAKDGGGFLFTYTDRNGLEGDVIIYPDTYGVDGIETTFRLVENKNYHWPEVYSRFAYAIRIDEEVREFMLGERPAIKSTVTPLMNLMEDVTPLFKERYPDVERVFTTSYISIK